MGIYIIDYGDDGQPGTLGAFGGRAQNVLYTYDGDTYTWASPTPVYWRDEQTPVSIYGYYPGQNYIADPTAWQFSVQTDQSTQAHDGELSGYEQSDLLWGRVPRAEFTQEQIVIRYSHILAGVRVILERGEGISDTEWQKLEKIVLVENTVPQATVDLSTGSPTPAPSGGEFSIRMASGTEVTTPLSTGRGAGGEASGGEAVSGEAAGGEAFRAVVIPQTVAAGQPLITLTLNGQTYTHSLTTDMHYLAGKLHNFTLTVNRREATGDYETQLTADGITPWVNDEASHQFSAMAYVTVHCPEPGKLEESIRAAGYNPETVQNLKVSGELTKNDIYFLNGMPLLKHLNIKEIKIKNVIAAYTWTEYGQTKYCDDDVLPAGAFAYNKSLRSIILPKTLKGIGMDAMSYMHLMNSTLEIPEGVTHIGKGAFVINDYNGVSLIIPNSVDSIEAEAFASCHFDCELQLSDNIRYIGENAFRYTDNMHGIFHFPSKLTSIGAYAFSGLGLSSGEIEIPQGMTEIPYGVFDGCLTNRISLTIPEGVQRIGGKAFSGLRFNSLKLPSSLIEIQEGEWNGGAFSNASLPFQLLLPQKLQRIGKHVFYECGIEGELNIPESCVSIGEYSFCGNHISKVSFSSQLEYIPSYAFANNDQLQEVTIPKFVDRIGDGAFASCPAIQSIISLNTTPPSLGEEVFGNYEWYSPGVHFDKCILQVPEQSIESYRQADGWKQFQNITPYQELAVNITDVAALHKGMKREGIIRAEGAWEVTQCPSWCTVEPMNGTGKGEVIISILPQSRNSAEREGQIAFSLKEKNYTIYVPVHQYAYEYGEDETIILQRASAGAPHEVPLFIVGDGYNAEDIASGKYLEEVKEQVEYLFSCEPYKTYRNYFTISTAIAVSPSTGIPSFYGSPTYGHTRFDTSLTGGSLASDNNMIWQYALEHSDVMTQARESECSIIVLLNTTQGSNDIQLEDNGRSITLLRKSTDIYPYDQRSQVLRDVGGQAFGKLATEDVQHFTFAKSCTCPGCLCWACYYTYKSRGWFENISLSAKRNEVPWSELIYHPKYASYVDVYEGAYRHARGFYRSEEQSVMSTYIPYFNAISRMSIVKRIMQYAGKSFSFDEFVQNDKIETPE